GAADVAPALNVEECVTCASLDTRPAKPRPIDERSRSGAYGGPRSLRCATHYREHVKARRQAASNARSRKRSGLDEDARQDVLAEQDGVCALCLRRPARTRLNLDMDHDHDKAAEHDHPEDIAC